jgi:hypothetical protein
MLDQAYQGDVGFQLYESRRGDHRVVIAERLRIQDGRIVESLSVTDMGSFAAFMGGPAGSA